MVNAKEWKAGGFFQWAGAETFDIIAMIGGAKLAQASAAANIQHTVREGGQAVTPSAKDDLRTLEDVKAPNADRLAAADRLAESEEQDVLDALLLIACDPSVGDQIATAVGASLGIVLFRHGQLERAPLSDFTGPAFLGFDDRVALLQMRPERP